MRVHRTETSAYPCARGRGGAKIIGEGGGGGGDGDGGQNTIGAWLYPIAHKRV